MTEESDILPAEEADAWTEKKFLCVTGQFTLSREPLPYYLTSASIYDLERFFETMDKIGGSERWGLKALFQRDINLKRVEESLVDGYLEKKGKNKFFPPLTIALVPYDPKTLQIQDKFDAPQKVEVPGQKTQIRYGNSIELTLQANGEAAHLRWNRHTIKAVAIDGQHRLAALKMYGKRHPGARETTHTPINIVIPHPGAGVNEQVRELFIDINNTARGVDKARLIILDDRDPFACMTRNLIADTETAIDEDRGVEMPRLPFWAVDWKNDGASPREKHQVTTLVLLHKIVLAFFKGGKLRTLDQELSITEEFAKHGDWGEFDIDSEAVQFDAAPMGFVEGQFETHTRPFILGMFHNVDAWHCVIEKVLDEFGAATPAAGVLRDYLLVAPRDRFAWKKELAEHGENAEQVLETSMAAIANCKNPSSPLLYTSIGQRALFSEISNVRRTYGASISPAKLAEAFANDINHMATLKFFDTSFQLGGHEVWQGLCMKGEAIAVSEASVGRLAAMIALSCHAIQFKGSEADFQQSLSRQGPKGLMGTLTKAYTAWLQGPPDEIENKDEAKKEAQRRILAVLRHVRRTPFPAASSPDNPLPDDDSEE